MKFYLGDFEFESVGNIITIKMLNTFIFDVSMEYVPVLLSKLRTGFNADWIMRIEDNTYKETGNLVYVNNALVCSSHNSRREVFYTTVTELQWEHAVISLMRLVYDNFPGLRREVEIQLELMSNVYQSLLGLCIVDDLPEDFYNTVSGSGG